MRRRSGKDGSAEVNDLQNDKKVIMNFTYEVEFKYGEEGNDMDC